MVNHKEILRLKSLGPTHREITDATGCGRNTVTRTLARAREQKLSWQQAQSMSQQEVSQRLFPTEQKNPVYKMPDQEWVHREMQKSDVTLSLLWVEYCEQCRQNDKLPYKSTQFNKYYADYVHKTKATMHLEHRPGETMQVDWAGQTAALVDTGTGERLDAYLFVAVLPYSSYAYTEAFLDMKQEAWITGHLTPTGISAASPAFLCRTTSSPVLSRTPVQRLCLTNPTRRCRSTTAPPFFRPVSAVPRARLLWRGPLAWSLSGSWRPYVIANFCSLWN